MKEVFVIADNIISPVALSTAENFSMLAAGISGVQQHTNAAINDTPFYASLFPESTSFIHDNNYTRFEQLLIASIEKALQQTSINPADKKTLLIISTTKGNISLLETETYNASLQRRIALTTSAKLIASYFNFSNTPLIVSNACISGVLAIITAMRFIKNGLYENVVVAGADVISKFVFSGFQSFQALSNGICRPFDKDRDGINLGEGAATIILSSSKKDATNITVKGGSTSNDANHISGPSRTGDELAQAMEAALKEAGLSATDINLISAHGTATLYNDEMEAKAITTTNMQHVPVNSLKAYYGHTLGAAGLIESIISIESLRKNTILPSKGFETIGVSKSINVCDTIIQTSLQHCIKTASGFGGCNAAVIFSKQ